MVSAEIGYEWQIGNPYHRFKEQYVGLQLYANYGVWSWTEHSDAPFLSVSAITGATSNPQITTQSISSTASQLNNLSIGLRLYYTIQTVDYPGRGWHHYRR